MADELVQQIGESGIQFGNNAPLGTIIMVETGVVPLTVKLEKVQKEASSARAELDKLYAPAVLVAKEHRGAMIKVREEQQGEPDTLRARVSQREAAISESS